MSGGKNKKKRGGVSSPRPQGVGTPPQERKSEGTPPQEQRNNNPGTGSPSQERRNPETTAQGRKNTGTNPGTGSPAQERRNAGAAPGRGTPSGTRTRKEPTVLFGSSAASIRKPAETPPEQKEPSDKKAAAVRTVTDFQTAADVHTAAAVRTEADFQTAAEFPPNVEKDAGSPILRVEDINVYYGSIHAIKGISFEVREGEIVTLIGANGAGKSTTLNTVAGLLRSRTGSVSFLGESLARVPCHKVVSRGLALVPEGRRIFLQMTVRENLEMGAYTQSPAGIGADLEKVYHYFPRLQEREGQIAGTLSGGEQQMLAMGRALMSHPKLLMLDEPSMGLAPILVEQIFEIIRNLHAAGSTILLVEQNARAALSIADRGYVLETGKIVTSGRGRDLLESPEIKKAYLGG